MKTTVARILIPLAGLLCLLPQIGSATALIAGVAIALIFGNPYIEKTRKLTPILLMWSVIGLGAGMNLETVAKVGLAGLGYTVGSILFVTIIGYSLGRLLKLDQEVNILITMGTAICGGSAIAAITPVLRAKSHNVSIALGTVFILNAVALVIFPPIGHYFQMTEGQFGLWCALAIHDTSSVVGAAVAYGPHAAEIGTTVKLARALWIVPITFVIGLLFRDKGANSGAAGKAKKPWFILGFLIAAALVTWVPALQEPGHIVELIARRALVLTLFLIGAGLSRETLKQVGFRPFLMGLILWLITGTTMLAALELGWIHSA